MVWKTVATHRPEEMNHLRLREKFEAWRKSRGFDRCDVYDEQWRPASHGYVCSVDDPKRSQIDVDSDCRLPLTPEETSASMWAELNVLKQEVMRPQPLSPQDDVSPPRPSARSPPQERYCVPRVVTREETAVEKAREERMESPGTRLKATPMEILKGSSAT